MSLIDKIKIKKINKLMKKAKSIESWVSPSLSNDLKIEKEPEITTHSSNEVLLKKINDILNEPSFPKPFSIWRHYKGDEYQCLPVCIRESTEQIEILYLSVKDPLPIPWSRPYSEWKEIVEYKGEKVPRFTLVKSNI